MEAAAKRKETAPESARPLPCRGRRRFTDNATLVTYGVEPEPAWRCDECGYVFFDTPDEKFLDDWYQKEFPAAAASWYTLENDYLTSKTDFRLDILGAAAERYFGRKDVVYHESGCSFGGTVARLIQEGYDATGTELNATAVAEGVANGCDKLHAEKEADFFRRTGRKVDILYCLHALEHMPYPVQFLQDIRPAVTGIVVLHVPNAFSFLHLKEGFRKNHWFGYPAHLHMFLPGSLPCLAEASGYTLLEVETRNVGTSYEENKGLIEKYHIREPDVFETLLGLELRFILTPQNSLVSQNLSRKPRLP